MKLRPYQSRMIEAGMNFWRRGARAVLFRLATGGGKSITAATAATMLQGRGVVQAHRAELVGQLSLALSSVGLRHNLTCSSATRRLIVDQHFEAFGRSMYDPGAAWSVESVDTAIKRTARLDTKWLFPDECHHVLPANKWGKAAAMYEHAQIGGWTATPCRTDGQGLGIEAGGLFNVMVDGPGAADLMAEAYLCEYDIKVSVPTDLDLSQVQIAANGELNMRQAATAVHASGRIVGDAVRLWIEATGGHYQSILFAVDIESAKELHARYIAAGVPCAVVTGEDLDADRAHTIREFKAKRIRILINVDLFGEGFDVPGVQCVIMCRPTASFQWFSQAVGRALRPDVDWSFYGAIWDSIGAAGRKAAIAASAKPRGLVLDLVGNFARTYKIGDAEHVGAPELFVGWSLSGRTKRQRPGDEIPQKNCLHCFKPYERYLSTCPHCGQRPPAAPPSAVQALVDGNLYDYDPQLLARLRAEVARIDAPAPIMQHLGGLAAAGARNQWHERQQVQAALREAIALWAGHRAGRTEDELHREFYLRFGVDVLGAMALGASPAEALRGRIMERLAM